jgi:hypothetical protein
MRHYLWNLLEEGMFHDDPEVADLVRVALRSPDPEWISDLYEWISIQGFKRKEPMEEQASFREPREDQLRGQILVGTTTSGHPVKLPLESFGRRGHTLITGATGTGKSTLLNFVFLQLADEVPVTAYDSLNQSARVLVPYLPAEKLGVLDFKDYRRNVLVGAEGTDQLEYLRAAKYHLMDGLGIEPVTMKVLLQICEEIIQVHQVATIPRILKKLDQPGYRSSSHKALQNRLVDLTLSGDGVFTGERGIDLGEFFSKSMIFNLKNASVDARRLILHDHYFYLTRTRRVAARWKLRNVFLFHEAASLVGKAIGSGSGREPYFHTMMREARNYGVGFLFADQVPQREHTTVRSNLGTKLLFRLEDPAALESFKAGMGLRQQQQNLILNLPDRHLVMRRPDIPFPFQVKVQRLF